MAKKHKLKTKIVLRMTLVVSLLVLLTTVVAMYNQYRELNNALTIKATIVTNMTAEGMIPAVWNLDLDAANGILKGLLSDAEFSQAVVKDEKGKVFASIKSTQWYEDPKDNDVSIKKALMYKDQKIGELILHFTKAEMFKVLYKTILWEIVLNFMLIIILLVGLLISTNAFIYPLASLVRIMRQRARGDYSKHIQKRYYDRGDEISDVALSMRLSHHQQQDEAAMITLTQSLNTETKLSNIIRAIVAQTTEVLRCERTTLFLYDADKNKLWTEMAEGLAGLFTIDVNQGIVGEVFKSRKLLNIQDVQSHPSFRGDMKGSGFVTRNMLCAPLFKKDNSILAIIQCLNHKGSDFNEHDVTRLNSICMQAAIAIENNTLFDETVTLKNYQQSILESLTNGVIAFDHNFLLKNANSAAVKLLNLEEDEIIDKPAKQFFHHDGAWVKQSLEKVLKTGDVDIIIDGAIPTEEETVTVNTTASPLKDHLDKTIGVLLVLEDITTEKRLMGTMSKYMNKEIVDEVLSLDEGLIRGEEQKATILFSDIRDFTTMSENIGGVKTVELLNHYFEAMVPCLFNNNGILDKYIGDAIMGVFGVPYSKDNDAINAVDTSIEMFQALERFNANQRKMNAPVISIGIGLNTGMTVAGNIGASKRVEYTVIGDTVNLAARIEGLSKVYGAPLLISEHVKVEVGTKYLIREIDAIRVKGRKEPCLIYEVMDHDYHDNPDKAREIIMLSEEGLRLYRAQSWVKAMKVFQTLKEMCNDDVYADLLISRCQHFKANKPGDDWDGVWTMTAK